MKARELEGKRALITGASRGIGAAIREAFLEAGAEVLAPTRTQCDLASLKATRDYLEVLDAEVDILVNCAGMNRLAGLGELEAGFLAEALRIHLETPTMLIRALAPGMQARKWGRILNLSSIWAGRAKARRGAYAAAKAGLEGMTRVLAVELAPDNVLVNALAPGFVDTALTRANLPASELAAVVATVPLGRLAQPAELAQAALFLCSPRNTYMTGQTLVVDGGFQCR